MANVDLFSSFTNLKVALARDPKKALILGSLVLVLGVLWGRLFIGGSNEPSPARAAVPKAENPLPSEPGSYVSPPVPTVLGSGKSALETWLAGPRQPVTRNLFAIKLEYFPTDAARFGKKTEGVADGFWTQLEKSMTVQADQTTKRENLIANLRTLASGLRLESTIMGALPKAMIDGVLVGEGDIVATLRVVKIDQRRIIVERDGIRLEIQMK